MTDKEIKYSNKTLQDLFDLRDKPKDLFDLLIKIKGFGKESNKVLADKYLLNLNNKLDVNVLKIAKKAIDGGSNVFIIVVILTDVVHKMKFNYKSLCDLLSLLYEKMSGDMAMGSQYNLVDKISKSNPKNAYKILRHLIQQEQDYTIGNITTLIQNLYSKYPNKIWVEIQSLISSKNLIHKKCGILSLGAINYKFTRDQKRIKETISILNDFKDINNSELNESVLISFSQLIDVYHLAGEKIVEFSLYNDVRIQYKVSSILFGIFHNYHNHDWYKRSLFNLSNVSVKYPGIINNIDFILSNYIKKGDFELVHKFLLEWGCNSDFNKERDVKITDFFNSTFYKILNNKDQLQKLITIILNNDNFIIHTFLIDISSKLSIEKSPFLELDINVINKLAFKDLVYICRKILGYIYQSDLSLYLVLSILKRDKIDKKIEKLVFDVITLFIGRNYCNTTIQNIKQLRKEKKINKIQDKVATQILKALEGYLNTLNKLPELKELKVGKLKRYRINFVQSKIMSKEIGKSTREKSIFMQFAQNVPLKYGVGWFNYYKDDYSEISFLHGISHSIEYPKLEITNIVGSNFQRATFRMARRGDI